MGLRFWNKPSKPPGLQWSKVPGAFERHLQRRYNNPLFPAERRRVSAEELAAAVAQDAEALAVARKRVLEIHQTFDESSPSWQPWYLHLDEVRQRIDDTREQLARAGGDISTLDAALVGWRKLVIDAWRETLKADAQGLKTLEEAATLELEREKSALGTTFVRQLISPAAPIPKSEVVPALLCEDPSTVALFVEGLADKERANALKWATEIVSAAVKEGFDPLTIHEQLYAIGFPRHG